MNMNAYIVYNSEYNVLICKQHECAISAEFLTRHFRTEHEISLELRQEILTYASQYTPTKPTDLVYTRDRITPIPYLRIIHGFQCDYDQCDTIHGTLGTIKKHCRVNHQWQAKDGQRWFERRAQTFYQGNGHR